MDEENEWYYPIDYRTWRKVMLEVIERLERELNYYLQAYVSETPVRTQDENLRKFVEEIKKKHYLEKIQSTLEAILENLDILNTVSLAPNEYLYYIDRYGTPTAIWVGRTLKRKMRKPSYIV